MKGLDSEKNVIDLESRLTGISAEKNLAHQITYSNIVFAKYAGTQSPEANVGLNDYQLPWHEYAHFYEAHEKDAIQGIAIALLFL